MSEFKPWMGFAPSPKVSPKDKALQWLMVAFAIICVALLFAAKPLLGWWECSDVCERNGHETLYKLTQGCFCVDENGKPYNPKDER